MYEIEKIIKELKKFDTNSKNEFLKKYFNIQKDFDNYHILIPEKYNNNTFLLENLPKWCHFDKYCENITAFKMSIDYVSPGMHDFSTGLYIK